jgi:putative aminopeptidase FrvX
MRWFPRSPILAALALTAAGAVRAQALDSLVLRLGAMSAVTGLEDAMADSLLAALPGAAADRAGNVVLTRGSGTPVRIAACPMDEVGWIVGAITPEGYLTLRRVGATAMGPLYDQFLEGQRVTVFGRRGSVPGVVGVRSTHLTRGRTSGSDDPFNLDNAYVDVGAQDPAGVQALGIAVLAPLTRAKLVHRYGPALGLAAAPWAAERAACAALLSAARRVASGPGTTIVAFTRRRHFAQDGAGFLATQYPDADILLLGGTAATEPGSGPLTASDSVLAGSGYRRVTSLSLPARYPRTPVETVAFADVAALEQWLAAWLGGAR